ncbi:MAG: AAA family ATPase [Patescibacteria group bacterium]|nr:AAA family ATPase [Patescibacteria group bacterium]
MIIGITGTLGAGKGTIVEYLLKKGFKHYSVRAYLTEEIKKRGLEINRDSMVQVANDLREKNSPSYLAEQLFKQAQTLNQPAIIESLRTVGEVESLKNKGEFYLLAVDADPEIRYRRVFQRQSSTDNISFEKFLEDEEREMKSDDPNKQNLQACIKLADFKLENNDDFENLYQQIDQILNKISSN